MFTRSTRPTTPRRRRGLTLLAGAAVVTMLAAGCATTRVSVDSAGGQGNDFSLLADISADSRFVAGDTNDVWDVFRHDTVTGITDRVSVNSDGSQGNDYTDDATISVGGRYVAFESTATNLVPGDTNNRADIFVHDTDTGGAWVTG